MNFLCITLDTMCNMMQSKTLETCLCKIVDGSKHDSVSLYVIHDESLTYLRDQGELRYAKYNFTTDTRSANYNTAFKHVLLHLQSCLYTCSTCNCRTYALGDQIVLRLLFARPTAIRLRTVVMSSAVYVSS